MILMVIIKKPKMVTLGNSILTDIAIINNPLTICKNIIIFGSFVEYLFTISPLYCSRY